MSKIAEQKALEAYPIKIEKIYMGLPLIDGAEPFTDDVNIPQRNAYIQGYDQAMQDIQEQAEKSVIEKSNGEVTIEDLVAYNQGFKTGRELTMKDFLQKACEWLEMKIICYSKRKYEELIEQFKNYMQNE